MENKKKTKSVNRVIYILMAAMLVLVMLVSAFTVASRRGKPQDGDALTGTSDSTAESTSDSASDTDNKPTVDTAKPPFSNDARDTETSDNKNTDADTTEKEKPTSTDVRYFVVPAVGSVSKGFEIDVPVYSVTMNDYRAHVGADITANIGSDVVASSAGIVSKVWVDPLMGCSVTLDHGDNIYTTYKNLAPGSTDSLKVGDRVAMGQTIGAVGESALIEIAEEPHVHVEMTVDGKLVDPLEYMSASGAQEDFYEY